MPKTIKIAVLISGNGSNLQALIDVCRDKSHPAEIALVISNKASAYGLERAKLAGIPSCVITHTDFDSREAFDEVMHQNILEAGCNLICLAGFMRLLTPAFVNKWHERMLNIHPSLLPNFKGAHAHRDVLAAGEKESGCTVHYVIPEMDAGPIILQKSVPVHQNDTEETLAKRVHAVEHTCYPEALTLVCEKILHKTS